MTRLPLFGTFLVLIGLAGASSAAHAQWGAQPVAAAAAEITEVLDLGNDVQLTLRGTPGADSMDVRLRRSGTNSVLSQCSEVSWQVDGASARMPVAYTSEASSGRVAETLSGIAGTNNATMIGNARAVTLTVCGATFTMTSAQLSQVANFSRRLSGGAAPQQQPAQEPAQQEQPWGQQATVSVEADVDAEVFVAPEPEPEPEPEPVVQQAAPQPAQQYAPPAVQPVEDESVAASRTGMIFGATLMGVGLAAVPWWISRRRVLNDTCPCLDQQRISRSRWAAVGISLGGLALGGLVFALGVKQRIRARRNGLTSLDLEIRGDGLSLNGTF